MLTRIMIKIAEEAGESFFRQVAKQALEVAIVTAVQNVAGMVSETLTGLALQKMFGSDVIELEGIEESIDEIEPSEIEPPGYEGDPDEEVLPQPEPIKPKPRRKKKETE